LLIGYALFTQRDDKLGGVLPAPLFAVIVALPGPALYWLTTSRKTRRRLAPAVSAD
jgi:hypothetical protein